MGLFLNIWKYRQLLLFLSLRDVKTRYKQALLGILWSIIAPLFQAIIFVLVFDIFLKLKGANDHYFLVVYSGFIFWNFFSQSISSAASSISGNYNLVTKAAFPKELLVFTAIIGRIPDLLMSLIILFSFIIFYKLSILIALLLIVPILSLEIFLIAGIGLLLASTNVYVRDIGFLTPFLLTVWMYLTPVIYSSKYVPNQFNLFISFNPMTGIIESFRNVLFFKEVPDLFQISTSLIISVLLIIFGYLVFKKLEKGFADNI